ncbi:hypothetical protein [Yersinia phage fHe-Yen9-04]|uniref:Uncharacterized protein n=1 Tax=Yersinia phage fHe-Yen9-04 TaxID=2052742 RepID=A0A2C9CWG0_9CAUD|nr:hypothetical protein FDJ41_gp067 [Yersinia phage fHe-Yen9-04]SOK58344.1 hypothetical protein [Yersinia phage fHe-Yen9-04]VUE36113.1 hypothetical protein [Yersinia phage fHe-Yen9-04]
MEKTIYLFYYTSNEIVDHDHEYNSVYEDVHYNLGSFSDLQNGLEYYQSKYPDKEIKYQTVRLND